MKERAIWRSVAEEDLSAAYLHIGAESPEAAERLLDAVESTVRFLLETPLAGRLREFRSARAQDVRSWPVRDFSSYLIFYRPVAEDIEVIRLLHGARDLPLLLDEGEAGEGA